MFALLKGRILCLLMKLQKGVWLVCKIPRTLYIFLFLFKILDGPYKAVGCINKSEEIFNIRRDRTSYLSFDERVTLVGSSSIAELLIEDPVDGVDLR